MLGEESIHRAEKRLGLLVQLFGAVDLFHIGGVVHEGKLRNDCGDIHTGRRPEQTVIVSGFGAVVAVDNGPDFLAHLGIFLIDQLGQLGGRAAVFIGHLGQYFGAGGVMGFGGIVMDADDQIGLDLPDHVHPVGEGQRFSFAPGEDHLITGLTEKRCPDAPPPHS